MRFAKRLSISFTLATAAALAALTPVAALGADNDAARIRHVVNRLSFGPTPGELERVGRIGVENYIREQLDTSNPSESLALAADLNALQALTAEPAWLYSHYSPTDRPLTAAEQAAIQRLDGEAVDARLMRAVRSQHQLREVMVDFWFNHFNVYSGKGPVRFWLANYEDRAIRPYALGRFRDLLGATAHHPAMLFYLDNWQSAGRPGPVNPKKPGRNGLNENYARELMELHTLGVGGGYSQHDVIELARILTGWGFKPKPRQSQDGFTFYFDPTRHDGGTKTLLGLPFMPNGQAEGERALDLLVDQPATAQHLARQLAEYFVADDPPQELVDAVAAKFHDTHGDIRQTLDTLFHRPEFWDAPYRGVKFKTPYQYVVSTARALGPLAPPPEKLAQTLRQFGMPLYGYLTPDGYKNSQQAWLSPETMSRRITFAVAVASGRFSQAVDPKQGLDPRVLATTLGNPLKQPTWRAIAAAPPNLRAAMILGSPEFNHR